MLQVFGDFELDGDRYELRRAGQPIKLEPKVFNVVAYLIAHCDRVVSKQELFDNLWPGEFVTDAALTYCIKAARRAVDDDGVSQRVIATVQRRGYRFVAALQSDQPLSKSAPAADPIPRETPFIGREQVLAKLEQTLAGAAGGRGGLVLLAGEPGIGKTRTCDELAHVARRRNVRVLIGRCYEGEGAPPFWPWVQILRAHLRSFEPAQLPSVLGDTAGDLVQLLPELADRLPALHPRTHDEQTPRARVQLFESVRHFLEAASREHSLVLILDDIHWADQPSLLLLQFIARTLDDSRVFVLATYRDTDVRPRQPIALALGDLARAPNSLRIHLDGLSVEDVARFVEQTVGHTAAISLVTALHHETEGNPFFVTEIVRLLADSGQIDRMANASVTLTVPSTVRDAIQRRTAQLSPSCNEMLMAAAVLGRDFDINTLMQTWNREPEESTSSPQSSVLDLLDEARAARIIEAGAAPLGTYRFVHALIRETLYDALPTSDRVRFHRRAGESLEQHSAGASLSELAHHFSQAAAGGDVRKGAVYSIRAAEFAADRLAYEEAALHYERAIQFGQLDPELGRRRAALQLELGHNQWRAGEFARARATFQAAASTARGNGDAEQLARAALGYGGGFRGFTLGTVDPVLIDLLDEALAALPQHDSALRAQVTARQALALYDTPDSLPRRDGLSHSAVAMAKRVGDAASHLGALCCRHWATWGPDNLEDRTAVATEMVALAEGVDDHEMALQAHRFHLIDAIEIGDIEQVSADLAACEALAERLRQPYYTWYVLAFRGLRAFLDGRFEDSERFSQEALAVGQRAQNRNVSQMYGAQMLALRREQGRADEVEPMLQGLVAQFPTVPSWRCGLAYVLNELDRLEDARTQFEILAADDFSGIPRDTFWLVAMQGTIGVCVSLADRERAAVLYRLVRPYERHFAVNVVGTCVSSVARALGCLAGLLDDTENARRHFESALAMETRLGALPLIAHTQHDYAVMLLRLERKSDRDKARQLLGAAQHTFEQLGMHTFAKRAGRLLTQSPRRPKSQLPNQPKLTALRR